MIRVHSFFKKPVSLVTLAVFVARCSLRFLGMSLGRSPRLRIVVCV